MTKFFATETNPTKEFTALEKRLIFRGNSTLNQNLSGVARHRIIGVQRWGGVHHGGEPVATMLIDVVLQEQSSVRGYI